MQMLFSKDISANSGFIYLVVNIQDESPFYGSYSKETSQCDAVEIFFDMDTNSYANQGAYKNGSWHIRCLRNNYDKNDKNYLDGNSHTNTGNIETLIKSEDFQWALENNDSEYTMEFAFPVSVLVKGANFDGKNFRFDIKVTDNTTGEPNGNTFLAFWNSAATDNQWKDTRAFGLVEEKTTYLCDHSGDPTWPTSIHNAMTPPQKAIVSLKNNQLAIENVFGAITLYNLYGEAFLKSTINGNGSIDISNFTPGIYFVKGHNLTAKFIK
jgi:hypothetical protein